MRARAFWCFARARRRGLWRRIASLATIVCLVPGCLNSLRQGWLDPTTIGNFERSATLDIRTSLSLEDTPGAVPWAEYPRPEDLELIVEEHAISPGDTLTIEIYELRERMVPYQTQQQVSPTGYINLPVVGRVQAGGLTVPEFEQAIASALQQKDVLVEPQVTISPIFLHEATYSIFGIGVSAADNAPLRAGTFPIRRPDLRVLEAINQVGGLNEFVTEVYIFRSYVPPDRRDEPAADSSDEPEPGHAEDDELSNDEQPAQDTVPTEPTAEDELFQAVVEPQYEGEQVEEGAEEPDVPELLEPDPSDPYIWVDGEFVPNPRYEGPPPDPEGSRPAPAFEAPMPTINWARLAGESTHRVLVIPAELLRTGDPEGNIYIRAGDIIRIVSGEIGVYYVMGQVNRVGPFAFNSEEITLKAAIAAAGGLAPLAWPDRCTVYRRIGQREQMIQVNLDRIFAGLDSDFLIRRGDIINVGTHPFAPFLQRIRALTLPNPASNVGYGFTYARNFADIDSFAVQQNPQNEPDRFPALFSP